MKMVYTVQSHTQPYRALRSYTGQCIAIQSYTHLYRAIHSYTGLFTATQSYTGLSRAKHSCTGLYRVMQGYHAGLYKVIQCYYIQGYTELYRAMQGYTEPLEVSVLYAKSELRSHCPSLRSSTSVKSTSVRTEPS